MVEKTLKCNPSLFACSDDSPNEPFYYYSLTTDWTWMAYSEVGYIGNYESYTKGASVKISKVCNPDWHVASWPGKSEINCETLDPNFCDTVTKQIEGIFTANHLQSDTGLQTWLNCPQCGCVDDNADKLCSMAETHMDSAPLESRTISNIEDANLPDMSEWFELHD